MKLRSTFIAAGLAAALATSMLTAPALAGPFQQGEDGKGTGISLTPATQVLDFRAFLPLRNTAALDALITAQQTPGSPSYHKWLSAAEFNAAYGPTADQLAAAVSAFRAEGFTAEIDGPRTVRVVGSAAQVQAAFATQLRTLTSVSGTQRVVAGSVLRLSPALASVGAMIPEFANMPLLHAANATAKLSATTDNRYSSSGAYWFTDLKQAYDYPSYLAMRNGVRVDGTGASVAILMSGDVSDADTAQAFKHEKWTLNTATSIPSLARLPVNGGAPYNPRTGGTFEATLDVQEVLGGAPGAATTLVTIPSLSDQNILDGYNTIVQANTYDIVSSSFGGPEEYYLPGYNGGTDYTYLLGIYESIFQQGNAQGITFVASSGDEGGMQNPGLSYFSNDPRARAIYVPSVSQPASSPHVTAVGGGNLVTSFDGTLASTYVGENGDGDALRPKDPYGFGKLASGSYWGAGGGISQVWAKPAYQLLVPTNSPTARTLPDVGMLVGGCPYGTILQRCPSARSAAVIVLGGRNAGVIGTSVSAPEFAGALALYVGQNGRLGNANTFLYQAAAAQAAGGPVAFHTAHPSFDGYWSDKQQGGAYDYIFGNGSPDVRVLFGFTDLPAAGNPKSPTNP